ncbi:DUF4397 domain-containing protein [Chitinophaga sp. SYP-B3965]|uniref:DUF4397 domain-containing protein n=1 Tax=Chitinophaga sp. SYP-B3965 TaxID=2663120 RepID=UPI001299A735|nr:DUF4397 domain-containing protein [Chitinophaga sp. SYP-B3965]MRG44406.1 DUF4397 domain-containing protein [Chitinophaga sp. SYP-B3965]
MKLSYIITCIAGASIALAACKKNTFHVTERDIITNTALIKIGYFSPSINNQGIQLKVNGTRVSNNFVYPIAFPGGGLNTGGSNNSDYVTVVPGETTITLSVPKVGSAEDSVPVLTYSQALAANKKYTFFTTDSVPNVSGIIVEDDTAPIDTGARIKLINLVPNVPAVDFYQKGVLVRANVKYKEVTEYITIQAGNDVWVIRRAGAPITEAPLSPPTQAINTVRQRIYTFLARGWQGGTGTLNPRVSAIFVQ